MIRLLAKSTRRFLAFLARYFSALLLAEVDDAFAVGRGAVHEILRVLRHHLFSLALEHLVVVLLAND